MYCWHGNTTIMRHATDEQEEEWGSEGADASMGEKTREKGWKREGETEEWEWMKKRTSHPQWAPQVNLLQHMPCLAYTHCKTNNNYRHHVELWSTCVLFRRSLRLELTSWAYPAININSCLQALTKDISTAADIALSALETIISYCFMGYISALTYYLLPSLSNTTAV